MLFVPLSGIPAACVKVSAFSNAMNQSLNGDINSKKFKII